MTRDDASTRARQRAAIIEAMARKHFHVIGMQWRARIKPGEISFWDSLPFVEQQIYLDAMAVAFDAQYGLARVCPIEATEEMIEASYICDDCRKPRDEKTTWRAMSAAGDLTNPPSEAK